MNPAKISSTLTGLWNYRGDKAPKLIVFLDANDILIPTKQTNRYSDTGAKGNVFSAQIRLEKSPARCTIRTEYFDAVKRIEIPIQIEKGVGLR